MKRLGVIVLIVFTLTTLSVNAKDVFALNGVKINFYPPNGFVAASKILPTYYNYYKNSVPSGYQLLEGYFQNSDVEEAAKSKDFYYFDTYFVITTLKKIDKKLDNEEFQSFKRYIKKTLKKLQNFDINNLRETIKKHKEFFHEEALQAGHLKQLGILKERKNYIINLNMIKMKVKRNGNESIIKQAFTISFCYVNGVIINIFVFKYYTSESDIVSLIKLTNEIINNLYRAN